MEVVYGYLSNEQVIKVLRQYNPWWRTLSAIKEESKPQKWLAYYEVLKVLKHTSIVELCQDEKSKVTSAFLITKQLEDFGNVKHETVTPILRVPAIVFFYLLGKTEAEGQNGKL